jgi:hypothetical protein
MSGGGSGSLARAVKYTGGLDPAVATLNDMWNRKRQQDYYNTLMTAYNQGQQQLQGLCQQQTGNPLVAQGQQNTRQQPNNQAGQNILSLLQGQPNKLPVGVAAPQQQTNNPLVSPTEKAIGNNLQPLPMHVPNNRINPLVAQRQQPEGQSINQTNPLPTTGQQPYNPRSMENYNKAMNAVDQFKQQMFAEALKDGQDPNTALTYAQMLGEYAQRNYAPLQKTWKDIAPGAEAVEYDSFGNPTGKVISNAKEKEYTGKGTIELTKDTDGYPAGTKVDITWNKNDPGDFKILGKASNNKAATHITDAHGRYHRIKVQSKKRRI